MEIFKDVKGYEGYYEISNLGRVRDYKGKIKSMYKNNKGYLYLSLYYKGKTYHGIVLDSCGACMKSRIIDVFVKDQSSVITSRVQIK